MKHSRLCHRCNTMTEQELSRFITASKSEHVGWQCLACRSWCRSKLGGIWIPKDALAGIHIEALPVAQIAEAPRCAKCGSRGAEEHHWAPKALFRNAAEEWPKDYLCKPCHDEWHIIVTPQLVSK